MCENFRKNTGSTTSASTIPTGRSELLDKLDMIETFLVGRKLTCLHTLVMCDKRRRRWENQIKFQKLKFFQNPTFLKMELFFQNGTFSNYILHFSSWPVGREPIFQLHAALPR